MVMLNYKFHWLCSAYFVHVTVYKKKLRNFGNIQTRIIKIFSIFKVLLHLLVKIHRQVVELVIAEEIS